MQRGLSMSGPERMESFAAFLSRRLDTPQGPGPIPVSSLYKGWTSSWHIYQDVGKGVDFEGLTGRSVDHDGLLRLLGVWRRGEIGNG